MITTPLRNTTNETSKFAYGLTQAALGVSRYRTQSASFIALDDLELLAHQYLRHCLMKNMSKETIKMKTYCLRILLDFHESYKKISEESLEEFSLELSKGDAVTHNTYLQHVKTFMRWASESKGAIPLHKGIIVPRRPRRKQPAPNKEQLKMILDYIPRSRTPLHNQVLFGMLVDCGLRVSELCSLNIEDLSLKTFPGSAVIRHGKGNKMRIVRIGETMTDLLIRYTKYRKDIPKSPVIISQGGIKRGQRMTRSGIRLAIKRLSTEAGVTGVSVSPHALRRSSSIQLLRNGGTMKEVQEMLGHERISTTEIYVNQAESSLEERFKTASPMDNL